MFVLHFRDSEVLNVKWFPNVLMQSIFFLFLMNMSVPQEKEYFFTTVYNLRKNEEIILFNNLLLFDENESEKVVTFLQAEFEHEKLNFPKIDICFSPEAAKWSARYIYIIAQSVIYREHKPEYIKSLLEHTDIEINDSNIITIDLCFRFLPDMLAQLHLLDYEDTLISLVEVELKRWNYSAIQSSLIFSTEEVEPFVQSNGMRQLYCNRIINYKNIKLAFLPLLLPLVKANLGIFANELWTEFNTELKLHETN
jgi:MoxR-vWA-beta-propeller ternary system domain bpX4